MIRSLVIAAAVLGVAAPAFAEAPVSAVPGALAGRSPHHAYVAANAGETSCGKTMHSIPAGKPHSYGANALPKPCPAVEFASTAPTTTAAD